MALYFRAFLLKCRDVFLGVSFVALQLADVLLSLRNSDGRELLRVGRRFVYILLQAFDLSLKLVNVESVEALL